MYVMYFVVVYSDGGTDIQHIISRDALPSVPDTLATLGEPLPRAVSACAARFTQPRIHKHTLWRLHP